MWKNANGNLIQVTDPSRIKFRTNISKTVLEQLNELANSHDTFPNYLLETGLKNLLAEGVITYNKETRPTDRVQYKTTYDKDLLTATREFAREHKLFINDVIEYSVKLIDVDSCKDKSYKNRIERV